MPVDKRKVKFSAGSRKAAPSGFSLDDDLDIDDLKEILPTPLAHVTVEAKLHQGRLRKAGLEQAGEYEGDNPQLPRDIESLDRTQLSNLMLDFQAALSTATALASNASVEYATYNDVADYLEQDALLTVEGSNEAQRRAKAATDKSVILFRAKARSAKNAQSDFQSYAKDCENKIKVLSRVGGFKLDEDDASDMTSLRKRRKS